MSYNKLGDLSLELDDAESARDFYQKMNEILERLAAADPNSAQARRDLVLSHYRIAQAAARTLEYDTAVEHYTTAIALLDEMIANGQNLTQSLQERQIVMNEFLPIKYEAILIERVLTDWHTFIADPDHEPLLMQRITHLYRVGRFDEIPQTAEMLRSLNAENPDNLYNAACGYALCANAIQLTEGEELTAEQQSQQQKFIDLALACLRESIAAGYSNFDHMRQDPDLAVLHDLPEFEESIPTGEPMPMAE